MQQPLGGQRPGAAPGPPRGVRRLRQQGAAPARRAAAATAGAPGGEAAEAVDVAVVGSGIIGLCVAHRLLERPGLSVALLDRQQPCAGATGAGQGYIWMAHRDPSSPSWELARRSKRMWEALAEGASGGGGALADALEWQANGSLLLATTAEEVQQLEQRAALLRRQGVEGVVLLSPRELKMLEPALRLPGGSQGLLVRSDGQINGRRTAFALLDDCKRLGGPPAAGRLLLGLHERVVALEPLGGGGVDVVTERRRVRARRGVVVAAGVWSGQLLADAAGQPAWRRLLQPRRGHLVEVMQPPPGMPPVHTGMMELSYTQHYSTVAAAQHGSGGGAAAAAADAAEARAASSPSSSSASVDATDITFTATTSASGSLLIGSSREFSGWEAAASARVVAAIMARASQFLPGLAALRPGDLLDTTRVGLRPFAAGGLPAVGPVPGLPGVVVAAGHEGSGLCLGPASAELAVRALLGEDGGGEGEGERELLAAAATELLPERRLAALAQAGA